MIYYTYSLFSTVWWLPAVNLMLVWTPTSQKLKVEKLSLSWPPISLKKYTEATNEQLHWLIQYVFKAKEIGSKDLLF